VGAVGLVLVAVWARGAVDQVIRSRAEEKLRVVLDAQAVALSSWLHARKKVLGWLAADARIRRNLLAVYEARSAGRAALLALPEMAQLTARLMPILGSHGLENFAFIDTTGRVLASTDPAIVGDTSEAYAGAPRAALIAGQQVAIPPFPYRRKLANGRLERYERVGFLLASPFRGTGPDSNRVIGWIDVLVDADAQVYPLLAVGRFGRTGETFALDRNGVMLSPSRFESSLRSTGLLPRDTGVHSPLNVRVVDPGGPLASRSFKPEGDPSAWPMTRMAASVVAGDSGVDVRGYRSYLGEGVLGAWQWLPEYAVGLATEQEIAELVSPMSILRRVIWALLGLLTLGALGLGLGGLHLRRQAGAARVGRQLGQYTLERLMGEGAMGAVYRARHALLRRPTAVKLLRPDRNSPQALRRFKKEVQATSQLVHPNTVTIFDYGHAPDGTFYYAMEYLRGKTLDQVVSRFGPMPENRVAHILRQVCGSLAEAHEAGLIHRDVKPQNIMLCHRGGVPDMVKVLDFGLVKESDDPDPGLTREGASVGTPLYMAPEVASVSAEIDARADLYSLGVVAYYLLTGEQPFAGNNSREVMRRHVEERPVPPSERLGRPLNEALEQTVLKCLAKSPGSRPQSARELETMLTDVVIPSLEPWTEADADAWWRPELPDLIGSPVDGAMDETPSTLTVDVQSRVGSS
jgi:serine/threonine protein kinase